MALSQEQMDIVRKHVRKLNAFAEPEQEELAPLVDVPAVGGSVPEMLEDAPDGPGMAPDELVQYGREKAAPKPAPLNAYESYDGLADQREAEARDRSERATDMMMEGGAQMGAAFSGGEYNKYDSKPNAAGGAKDRAALVRQYLKAKNDGRPKARNPHADAKMQAETDEIRGRPGAKAAAEEARRKQAEAERRAVRAEWDRQNGITSKQALERAKAIAGTRSTERGAESLENDVAELSKRVPTEAATLVGKLDQLETNIAGVDDIEGVGPIAGKLPDFMTSGQGQKNRGEVFGVVNQLLKMQSGSAVSEPEVERKMRELGLSGQGEAAFRQGLKNLRKELGATVKQKASGFRPEVVDVYSKRGGLTESGVTAKPLPKNLDEPEMRHGRIKNAEGKWVLQ